MQPVPLLETQMDALEIADLKTRVESILDRISGSPEPRKITVDMALVSDGHGGIRLTANADNLLITAMAGRGMGEIQLTMPMPVGRDDRVFKPGMLRRNEIVPLLHMWLAYLDAKPNDTSRLSACMSSILRAENPSIGDDTYVSVMTKAPYGAETSITSKARIPWIRSGNTKPVFTKEIEKIILDLHPSVMIQRTGARRHFQMRPSEGITVRVIPMSMPEILRTVSEMGVRNIRKPVLKAGLDLR